MVLMAGGMESTARGVTPTRLGIQTTGAHRAVGAFVLMAALALAGSGWASAHSLSPPQMRNMFINGQTIVRLESLNMLPETRDFRVTVFKDRELKEPMPKDMWDAIPVGFRSGSGESRGISIRIVDDGELDRAFICTESEDFGSQEDAIGLLTRVCSFVRIYRKGDFAKPKPASLSGRQQL